MFNTKIRRDKALAQVGLGASRNPTHYDKMSGYADANPTYTLKSKLNAADRVLANALTFL